MSTWRARSSSEQFFEFLRRELVKGRWTGTMPGVHRLSAEFQVNSKTVEAALQLLEGDGLLLAQGRGRRRKVKVGPTPNPSGLRVAILPYESSDNHLSYIVDLNHQLQKAGIMSTIVQTTQMDLKMDVGRISRWVRKHEADAWVIIAGSKELLAWFVGQPLPAFALHGRNRNLPIASASPDRQPAIREAVRRLCGLGHRRIVFLGRSILRDPNPGFDGRAFLEELACQGIEVGPYNLPNWDDSADGFQCCLDSLFAVTPPTALLIDEALLYTAAHHHLARKGILVPEHVSMICTEDDPTFAWCRPSIAHMYWDAGPVVRRVVRWANRIGTGKQDFRKLLVTAKFVEGGTIGPVNMAFHQGSR